MVGARLLMRTLSVVNRMKLSPNKNNDYNPKFIVFSLEFCFHYQMSTSLPTTESKQNFVKINGVKSVNFYSTNTQLIAIETQSTFSLTTREHNGMSESSEIHFTIYISYCFDICYLL